MIEPNRTLDPDAIAWTGKPSKADLGVHVLPLTFGGELTITEHDGDYQMHMQHEGVSVQFRLSVLDTWGVRTMFSEIVSARVRETEAGL